MCIYNFRWEELISLTKQRKELLSGAEQVHKFIRDASETNDRMNEKVDYLFTKQLENVLLVPSKL